MQSVAYLIWGPKSKPVPYIRFRPCCKNAHSPCSVVLLVFYCGFNIVLDVSCWQQAAYTRKHVNTIKFTKGKSTVFAV